VTELHHGFSWPTARHARRPKSDMPTGAAASSGRAVGSRRHAARYEDLSVGLPTVWFRIVPSFTGLRSPGQATDGLLTSSPAAAIWAYQSKEMNPVDTCGRNFSPR
jgi:hypothetical protein